MQGNEYRKTPFKMPYEKVCNSLKNEMFFYSDFLAYTNLPPKDTCPVPKVKSVRFFIIFNEL
jgi:hypothetical protein